MVRLTFASVLVASLVVCVGLPRGMQGTRAAVAATIADPTGAEVLKSSAEALAKVNTLSYSGKQTLEGHLSETAASYSGDVTIARAEAGGWKMCVEGTYGKTKMNVGYDGATAWSIKEREKQVVTRSIRNDADLKKFLTDHSAMPLVAWDLVGEKVLDVGGEAVLEKDAKAAGVDCRVVRIDKPAGQGENVKSLRYFIAKSDNLPRRIERISETADINDPAVMNTSKRVLELGSLKTGSDVTPVAFVVSVPDGFAVRAGEGTKRADREAKRGGGDSGSGGPMGGPNVKDKDRPARSDEPMTKGRPKRPTLNALAPEFEFKDTSGKTLKNADLEGNIVVLDFWAEWCGPCKMAMPSIQKVHEKFEGKNVRVFGVSVDRNREKASQYFKDRKYTYGFLNDDKTSTAWGVTGIPAIFVIDAEGKLIFKEEGFSQNLEKDLTREIERAMKN